MIDLHCHILPGIDDGPTDIAGSIWIAETASREGVKVIFATPHHGNGVYSTSVETIEEQCQLLNDALKQRKIDLVVYPGAEVHVNELVLPELFSEKIIKLGLNGRAVLLELPGMFVLERIETVIHRMVDHGIIPILAHPERNPLLLKHPHFIERLLYKGAMTQITAGSLLGDYGPLCRKLVVEMLRTDRVHCVGSDMHPGRKYRMADFKNIASKFVSVRTLERIVGDTAWQLIFPGSNRWQSDTNGGAIQA